MRLAVCELQYVTLSDVVFWTQYPAHIDTLLETKLDGGGPTALTVCLRRLNVTLLLCNWRHRSHCIPSPHSLSGTRSSSACAAWRGRAVRWTTRRRVSGDQERLLCVIWRLKRWILGVRGSPDIMWISPTTETVGWRGEHTAKCGKRSRVAVVRHCERVPRAMTFVNGAGGPPPLPQPEEERAAEEGGEDGEAGEVE